MLVLKCSRQIGFRLLSSSSTLRWNANDADSAPACQPDRYLLPGRQGFSRIPLPLPLRPHLNRIRGHDPRCNGGDQKIPEVEPRDHFTVAVRRGVDVGPPGGQQPPEQPYLFSFGIGIFFALYGLEVAYRRFGSHAGGGEESEAGQEGQFGKSGCQSLFGGGAFQANLPARQRPLAGRNARFQVLRKAFLRFMTALWIEKMAK